MEYAILRLGGKQYRVSPGDKLEVDRIDAEPKKSISVGEVLLVVSGDKVEIGRPVLNSKIQVKLLENKRGDKIRVAKFKAKSRYRKVIGFRAELSVLEIESIGTKGTTKTKKS
jgi:large subunit ribosomal protein L21